ncbi:ABC transporter substrate-binding protein [Sphaerisporangium melleum]|uniref:ABC transporter substrate-binding protein n=1 Tax=Sphaerisporangium melleum TaxID=321316 RepID=A0A917R9L0_9ACTN|nr:helical backbone metal receptor [Sphaerisporangium melleum]GGK97110.1 ABC transporter substrate-binding protein [Sphaerisporangium melleum]GII71072.1 ABC transporter substrate-binding protein [Sphaerisporangium melleum]
MRRDDLGLTVPVPGEVRRVVSLVPSLTESVAATAPELLVGATDWCSHPADLDVPRVRGTKNPDIDAIVALRPDLVIANEEENRVPDLDALRAAGVPVWVTVVRTLDDALTSLRRLLVTAMGLPEPPWLTAAEHAWYDTGAPAQAVSGTGATATSPSPSPSPDEETAGNGVPATPVPEREMRRAVVPVWRKPWMVAGRDTFAGDLLLRLGVRNLYAGHAERYPRVPLTELLAAGPDLVVLPDEPYRFTEDDGPGFFPGVPAALISGRHLTWYGPSLAEARTVLAAALAEAVVSTPGAAGR